MKKVSICILMLLALTMVLSACMSPAEREFRAMSAVAQMEGIKNISWKTTIRDNSEELLVVFSETEAGRCFTKNSGGQMLNCGDDTDHANLKGLSLFCGHFPFPYLPALEKCTIEKVEGKERMFRITEAGSSLVWDVTFDPEGRITEITIRDPYRQLLNCKYTSWTKTEGGAQFPAVCKEEFAYLTREIRYSDWKINLPEDQVSKFSTKKK